MSAYIHSLARVARRHLTTTCTTSTSFTTSFTTGSDEVGMSLGAGVARGNEGMECFDLMEEAVTL
jgi:hypothetical protein